MSTPSLSTILLLLSFSLSALAEESGKANETPNAAEENTEATSTAPKKPPRPRVEPDPFAVQLSNLQSNPDPDTEVVQIGEGENSFPGLYREYQNDSLYGAILFIVDEATHYDWKIATHSLRIKLSESGWSTLSLPTLPAIETPIPERTLPVLKVINSPKPPAEGEEVNSTAEASAPETPPATEEASTNVDSSTEAEQVNKEPENKDQQVLTSDRKQKAIERGTAATEWLKAKDIKRIIIAGHGTGATWAAELALELQNQTQNVRLMMIDAEQSSDISAPQLINILPELKITVLDIYSDHPAQPDQLFSSTAEKRKKLARKEKLKLHQIRMPFSSGTPQGQTWLAKRVRGLIDRLIVQAEDKDKNGSAKKKPKASFEQPPGRPKPI